MIDYPYVNLFCYPAGAGGKFLVNCLSLNDSVVFQNRELVKKQIAGKFSVEDKIKYINDQLRIAEETKEWDDLDLGEWQLHGLGWEQWTNTHPEIIKKYFDRVPWIQECIHCNLHLTMVAHNFVRLELVNRVWSKAKVIVFTNSREFVEERGYYIVDNLGYTNDSEVVESREHFDQLWNQYTKNLSEKFVFDVKYSYENCDNFYTTYTQVCDYLNLPITPKPIIENYFLAWKRIISQTTNQPSLQG
jgi:hypothetical protein